MCKLNVMISAQKTTIDRLVVAKNVLKTESKSTTWDALNVFDLVAELDGMHRACNDVTRSGTKSTPIDKILRSLQYNILV